MGMFDELQSFDKTLSDKKKERVDAASKFKKKLLEPSWDILEQGNYDVIDGDTVRMRDSGRHVRFNGSAGKSIDTFETDAQRYLDDPDRLEAHKKAYAKKTGKSAWTVTIDQLVDQGLVQKQRLQQHLDQNTANGGIEFQNQGIDPYGRVVAQFRNKNDNSFLEGLSGRENNANYGSQFNQQQRAEDAVSGEYSRDREGSPTRSYKDMLLDQPVNFTHGAAQMLNGIGQAATIITGTNTKRVDRFFHKNKERLENLKKSFLSPAQLRKERKARSESGFNEELFELNEKKYLREGKTENEAAMAAGVDEFVNSIRNLFQNPGKIIDATVESLPYMVAVGGVGRVAVNSAVKRINNRMLDRVARSALTKQSAKGAVAKDEAARITAKYIASDTGKRELAAVASKAGMTTVGLTEGISTAADVYDSVRNMTEKEAMQSEKYQALRFDEGLTHDEAVVALAEGAFTRTLASVTLMAGAAAKFTGAGAFESKMFTGLADIKKVPKVAKIPTSRAAIRKVADLAEEKAEKRAKAGIISKSTRAVAGSVGRAIKSVSPAGGKEAAEEFIQSGGGEFLSQLAEFDSTGKKIGPGVGQAAAEGAIIGFASGAGITAVTNSLRSIGDSAQGKKAHAAFKERTKNIKQQPKPSGNGPAVPPGGSTTAVVKKIGLAEGAPGDDAEYRPLQAFYGTLTNVLKHEFTDQISLEEWNTVKLHYDNAIEAGETVRPDVEKVYRETDAVHRALISEKLTEFYAKKDDEFTASDIAYITEAAKIGAIKKSDLKKLPPIAREGLAHAAKTTDIVKKATDLDIEGNNDDSRKGSAAEIKRVHFEKFGDTINAQGHRGMKAYQREMHDAIANNDQTAYRGLASKLTNFLQTQRNNIHELGLVITAGQNNTVSKSNKYKYKAGSSERLLKTMIAEGHKFHEFRTSMLAEYNAWHPISVGKLTPVLENRNPIQKDSVEALAEAKAEVEGTGQATPVKTSTEGTQEPVSANAAPVVSNRETESKPDTKDDKQLTARQKKIEALKAEAVEINKRHQSSEGLSGLDENRMSVRLRAIRNELAKLEKQEAGQTTGKPYRGKKQIERAIATYEKAKADNSPLIQLNALNSLARNAKAAGRISEYAEFLKTAYAALKEQGYEVPKLIGKTYDEGMKAKVDFVDDENAAPDSEIITQVKKPQINKDGKMVQAGHIVVTIGPPANENTQEAGKPAISTPTTEPVGTSTPVVEGNEEPKPVSGVAKALGVTASDLADATGSLLKKLSKSTVPVLKEKARELGIKFKSKILKSELVQKIADELVKLNTKNVTSDTPIEDEVTSSEETTPDSVLTADKVTQRQLLKDITKINKLLALPASQFKVIAEKNGYSSELYRKALTKLKLAKAKEGGLLATKIKKADIAANKKPKVSDKKVKAESNETLFAAIKKAFEDNNGITRDFDPDTGFYDRLNFVQEFGWSVPTQEALDGILEVLQGRAVVMPAAGLALWGKLLQNSGIRVIVSDSQPNVNSVTDENGVAFPVNRFTAVLQQDAVTAVEQAPADAVLFLAWPEMPGEQYVADVLEAYKGNTFIYIGEGYGMSSMSTEAFDKLSNDGWTPSSYISIPTFDDIHDEVVIYTRPVQIVEQTGEVASTEETPATPTIERKAEVTVPFEPQLTTSTPVKSEVLGTPVINESLATPEKVGELELAIEHARTEASPDEDTRARTVGELQTELDELTEDTAEPKAEAVDEGLAAQRDLIDRIQDVQELKNRLANDEISESDLGLVNEQDFKWLNNVRDKGTSGAVALNQLYNYLSEKVDPLFKLAPETPIAESRRDALNHAAVELNKENGKTESLDMTEDGANFNTDYELLRGVDGSVGFDSPVLQAKVLKVLEDNQLPKELNEVLKKRGTKTASLFSAIPNIMEILQNRKARAGLINALNLSTNESNSLKVFVNFYDEFSKHLNYMQRELQNNKNMRFADERLVENGLYYFMKSGAINPNVVAAMALESMAWLATGAPRTVFNDADAINGIFGRINSYPVEGDEMRVLAASGTIRNSVISEIGNAVFKHLNLETTNNSDIDSLFINRLILTLGGTAVTTLRGMDRIELVKVPPKWFLDKMSDETKPQVKGEVDIDFIRVKTHDLNSPQKWTRIDKNLLAEQAFREGAEMFQKLFGSSPNIRFPSFDIPTKVDTHVSRSFATIPEPLRKRIEYNQQRAWVPERHLSRLLDFFSPEAYLKIAHGYVDDIDMHRIHETDRKSVEGRNAGLMRDLSAAQAWNKRYLNTPFYFTYKVIRSGRVYIDSNVLNPQASKVHRFLFTMKEWKTDVPVSSEGMKERGNIHGDFILAVGLGLGVKVDKNNRSLAIDQTLAIFAPNKDGSPSVGMQAVTLVQNGPANGRRYNESELRVLKQILSKEGTHSLAALAAYGNLLNAANTGAVSFPSSLPMETDGVTNGTAAGIVQTPPPNIKNLGRLRKMYHAVGIFFKNDAVMYKNYQDYLEAGGLDNYQDVALDTSTELEAMSNNERALQVVEGKKGMSARRINYMRRNAATIFGSGLLPDINDLKDKVGRDWAKDPLMISAYGAEISSIIRKIISNAEVLFRERLAAVDTSDISTPEKAKAVAQEIANVLNSAYAIADVANHATELAHWGGFVVGGVPKWTAEMVRDAAYAKGAKGVEKSEYENRLHQFATNFVMPTNKGNDIKAKFEEAIQQTYGAALKTALDNKLAPMKETRDALNAANRLMNEIFVVDYVRRIDYTQKLLKLKNPNHILSREERQEIFEDMHGEGLIPSVATAMSQKLSDNLEITNYNRIPLIEKRGKAYSHLSQSFAIIDRAYEGAMAKPVNPKDQAGLSTRVLNDMPNTDIGVSGVVKMIHALDGVNNSYAWGNYPVLNVHDAQIGKLDMADQIAGETNLDFIEMHSQYSLVEEIHKSVVRMSVLLTKSDGRLNREQREKIYDNFLEYLKKHNLMPSNPRSATKADMVKAVIENLSTTAQETREAREFVFGNTRLIHQFAKDGSEKAVDSPAGTAPNILLSDQDLSADELSVLYRDDAEGSGVKAREAKIETFVEQLQSGNRIDLAISDYIQRDRPSAKDLLEVLQAAYKLAGHPAGKFLPIINSILQPHLGRTATKIGRLKKGEVARYEPGMQGTNGIMIFKRQEMLAEADQETLMVQKVVHEAIHAASLDNLLAMETENEVEFDRLFNKAIAWAGEVKTGSDVVDQLAAHEVLKYNKNKKAYAISEYLAWSLATGTPNSDQYSQWFASANIGNLMSDLFASLQDVKTGKNILYSSNDRTSDELFEGQTAHLLEGDKMGSVIDRIIALEQNPDDKAHTDYLRDLATNLIIPGIKSAEPLYQYVAENSAGNKNIGEIEGDVIRLEAAGNKLSSNADMSLLETAMHEYVHGFSKRAVEDDHAIRTELKRLFALAEAKLSVSDFLEAGDDTQLGLQKAQERYDYIFSNGKRGLHEFLAIGLTNKPLALALTRIENKTAVAPAYGSGILQKLIDVFNKVIQYVTGHSVQTRGGSVHQAMFSLGQNIIANNQRNLQRIQDKKNNTQPLSRVDRVNREVVKVFTTKLIEPLTTAMKNRAKDHVPTGKGIGAYAKSLTYSALRLRDKEVRTAYNEVYRSMRGGKDNEFFQITGELLPYDPENLGTVDSEGNTKTLGWIDLLRKSKVAVDMARQNVIEHTASFMRGAFDSNKVLNKATKKAVTSILLKTDLSVLMEGMNATDTTAMDVLGIQNLLNNPRLARPEITKLRHELANLLNQQNAGQYLNVFENQMDSLASIMVYGIPTVGNPMLNAHNIVKRFNLGNPKDQRTLDNEAEMINLVDRITSLKAFDISSLNGIKLVRDMANHEMSRTDVKSNGFDTLLGMQTNFRITSQEHLFANNPTQMMKGYVYEILDGDVNIEYVDDTKDNNAKMLAQGMTRVGAIPKDNFDPNRTQKVLWKGLRGLAMYQKAVVSLTDEQGRGANLFTAHNRDSSSARRALGQVRRNSFKEASNQFKQGYTRPGNNLVPILDDQGNITDYRYLMSDQNKQDILKKEDPFDKVLPRMFATIPDRTNTKEINAQVVDLLWDEYEALGNSKAHRFLEISKNSTNKDARDMYNLLPGEMQRQLREKFGSDTFYIRDDVVNLVMGFRKMSVANTTLFGQYTPIARQAEKIWQEVVSHIKATIAIRTPAVVIGNTASNTAMLLSEGIPPAYIRDKGSEAIAGMRQYTRDVRERDELEQSIGVDIALNKADVHTSLARKIIKLGRLRADIKANPVGKLVEEGLFTSIAEDLGATDLSISRNFLGDIADKARMAGVPKTVITAIKETYMLPGSVTYRAAIAATQYGDFVARYIKFKYDTQERGMPELEAIHLALAAFIYYDMPQGRVQQFLDDNGGFMFIKYYKRIQPIIIRMFSQNPVSATAVLAAQTKFLMNPLDENIAEKFGLDAFGSKLGNFGPNLDRLDVTEPSLLQWIFNPFGL